MAKSTVWYILRKGELTRELSNIKRPGCLQKTLIGKEKPFHNIQPSDEHSPRGRRVTVKVYNVIQIQMQRVPHKVQTRPD